MTEQAGENENARPEWWRRAVKKRSFSLALALILLLAGFFLGRVVVADTGVVPGSEEDPLVTAGWVEARLSTFSRTLRSELAGFPVETESQPPSGEIITVPSPAPVYEIVVLQQGTRLLGGHGTELILRGGRAGIIAAPGGGIADLTSGKDLGDGEAVPRDHLLLSPKDDGRGVLAETEVIFLIRGKYNTAQ